MMKPINEKKKGPLIHVHAGRCAGCLICALRCSLRFEKAFNPSKAKIKILRCVNSDTEYTIAFAADCDNCGICARFCPYDALTQEKRKEAV
jgi:ferredoxin